MKLLEQFWHPWVLNLSLLFNLQLAEAIENLQRINLPSDGQKCLHCGNMNHNRDNYFQLHEYPDWLHELQAKKGMMVLVHGKNLMLEEWVQQRLLLQICISLIPSEESTQVDTFYANSGSIFASFSATRDNDRDSWVIDSGATNHMTLDEADFTMTSSPKRAIIANANGVISLVTGASSVTLPPSLQLFNTLLVPSLSYKLLSVSQVTAEKIVLCWFIPIFVLSMIFSPRR